MEKTKILVGDSQRLVAEGLKVMLKDRPEHEVVGHASTGKEVLSMMEALEPDLLIVDVSLPQLDGIDTTRAVKEKWPNTKVLAHSSLHEIEYINSMLIEGASGYLFKGASQEEVLKAITTVLEGAKYLNAEAQATVKNGYKHTNKDFDGEYVGLTAREKEIIRLIVQEKTNSEMAAALFVSVETVKSHRKNLMTKLNVKSVAGLVKYAVDRCWV